MESAPKQRLKPHGMRHYKFAITRVKSTNVKCHYSPDEKTGKEREEKEIEKTETFAKSLLSFFPSSKQIEKSKSFQMERAFSEAL